MFKLTGVPAGVLFAVVPMIIIVACGGGSDPTAAPATAVPPTSVPAATAVPTAAPTSAPLATQPPGATQPPQAPTDVPAPTAAPEPTAAPVATVAPQPAVTPEPAATVAPSPTATLAPPATATPEPTPTSELTTTFAEFGFSLTLGRGADINPTGSPSKTQGAISFAYGEANTILTWTPLGDTALLALVDATYSFVQSAQPDLTFETLIDGEITADGQPGVFLGFKAVSGAGDASGGLIGSWDCPASDTSYTLTMTGADTTLLQIRFDEVLENFSCSTS